MTSNYALFQISLKALIVERGKLLVLITPFGYYDFPGGRINLNEEKTNFTHILKRELIEELSDGPSYDIKDVIFVSKRFYRTTEKKNHVLVFFYKTKIINSNLIQISEEHHSFKWVKPKDILTSPEKFASVNEFNQIKKYFKLFRKSDIINEE